MSVAIITSPEVSSQMTFAWDQPESLPIPANIAPAPTSVRVTSRLSESHTHEFDAVNTATLRRPSNSRRVQTAPAKAETCIASNQVHNRRDADGQLEFVNQRIGKPVRIGGIMFKLLKRYGITDEEIAQGILEYINGGN